MVEKDSIVTKGKNLIEYKKFTTNQLKSPATITKKLKKILRKATPNPIMRKAISSFQSNKNSKKAKILVIQDKSLYNIIFKNKKTYAILKQKKIKIRVTFPTQNSGNGHSGGSGS